MALDQASDVDPGLRIEVRHDDTTSITRIIIQGDVDAVTSDRVFEVFLQALREHRPTCVDMDVSGVTFLDSSGIRTLAQCQAEARRAGSHIVLLNLPPMVRRVLEITGLLHHFGVAHVWDDVATGQ
ncbi:STAS domain-containing protein [Symbioplanes lichenis]|uniref:STAS domain-containing protein n=1 Tax=Symbioplanes lichenis TaxID=1629072 RepID=UPI002738FAA4|nr:STAS domain-containing protein [Actinoplanes lichenis]